MQATPKTQYVSQKSARSLQKHLSETDIPCDGFNAKSGTFYNEFISGFPTTKAQSVP